MRINVVLAPVIVVCAFAVTPARSNTITVTTSNISSSAKANAGTCSQAAPYQAGVNCSGGGMTLDAGSDLLAGSGGLASGVSLYADSLPVNVDQPEVASGQASFSELFNLAGGTGGEYVFLPYTLQVDNSSDVFDASIQFGSGFYELTGSNSATFKTFFNFGQSSMFMMSLNATTPADPHFPSSGHAGATLIFETPYISTDPNATSGQPISGSLFPAPVPEPGTMWLVPAGVGAVGTAFARQRRRERKCRTAASCCNEYSA